MPPEAAGALAFLTLLTGALGFLLRGQIRGTNADKLWDAAEGLRKEQREEIIALDGRIRECETLKAIQATDILNLKLADETKDRKLDKLIRESGEKDERIKYLTTRVQELEAKA